MNSKYIETVLQQDGGVELVETDPKILRMTRLLDKYIKLDFSERLTDYEIKILDCAFVDVIHRAEYNMQKFYVSAIELNKPEICEWYMNVYCSGNLQNKPMSTYIMHMRDNIELIKYLEFEPFYHQIIRLAAQSNLEKLLNHMIEYHAEEIYDGIGMLNYVIQYARVKMMNIIMKQYSKIKKSIQIEDIKTLCKYVSLSDNPESINMYNHIINIYHGGPNGFATYQTWKVFLFEALSYAGNIKLLAIAFETIMSYMNLSIADTIELDFLQKINDDTILYLYSRLPTIRQMCYGYAQIARRAGLKVRLEAANRALKISA